MKTKEHAFYYGYIGLLCLSVLYRIATLTILTTKFELWDRFVVAATVSTCFFCVSDVVAIKRELSAYENVRFSLLFEKNAVLGGKLQKILKNELEKSGKKTDETTKAQLMKDFDSAMNQDKTFTGTEEKGLLSFIFNICGFFAFFLIIVFEVVFLFLYPIQDILTMVAFIIVLCGTAYKEHKIIKINDQIRQNIETQNRLMVATSVIEIYQEGKKKENG